MLHAFSMPACISNNQGGAVYVENAVISIGATAKVVFMHNVAYTGGAVGLKNGMITYCWC